MVLLFVLAACNPVDPLERALSEEISYSTYSGNGFTIDYPDWPLTENPSEVSVSKGYCTVIVHAEKMIAKQWYDAMINAINPSDVILADEEELRVKHSSEYLNFTMISDTRIYPCNDMANAVSVVCISEVNDRMQHLHERVFRSAACEEEEKTTRYLAFEDEDYVIEHPEWDALEQEGQNRVLGLTQGTCSLIVDKHNALPKDIINWLTQSINDAEDHKLLRTSEVGDTYYIDYELPFEQYSLTATTKIIYCNYFSYITQVICINDFIDEESEAIRDTIINSAGCKKEYQIPEPEEIKQKKETVRKEEPEALEEIEEIVDTNIGDEFGIDEEMIVYFINDNAFFRNIMKDFPKANIIIKDEDRELKIKATIDNTGRITRIQDGEHSSPDVTLIVPLKDALNIFSNAQNINPVTLIGFAINVRTEPPSIKNEVIQKVLRGEYN